MLPLTVSSFWSEQIWIYTSFLSSSIHADRWFQRPSSPLGKPKSEFPKKPLSCYCKLAQFVFTCHLYLRGLLICKLAEATLFLDIPQLPLLMVPQKVRVHRTNWVDFQQHMDNFYEECTDLAIFQDGILAAAKSVTKSFLVPRLHLGVDSK